MGFVMVIGYKYVRNDGLPNPSHGCVEVRLDKQDRFVAPIDAIEGAVHLIAEDEAEDERSKIKVRLVNNHIDLNTYYYVY
jgi:hypothetical protein